MEWIEVVDVIEGSTENFENCIYMWRNKVNGKLYVGQAKDFVKRTKSHKNRTYNENSKYDYNIPIHRAIRKYGVENFEICILEKNLIDYDEMNQKEIYYIEKYNTLANKGKGYNVSDGGKNGNNFAGKTKEEMMEISKKKSESQKGKQFSEEHKQKISENHANVSGKNHPQCRKVILLNTGEIFDYIKQASEKYGVNYSNITLCCQRKYNSAGIIDGKPAVWMYLEDYKKLSKEEIDKIKNQEMSNEARPKAVICVTTGKIYESTREAERQTGIFQSSVSRCCCGKRKSAGKDENGNKLVWMYLEDYLESLK